MEPQNAKFFWKEKTDFDGRYFYIGVAPFDISQDAANNYDRCGWYLDGHKLYLKAANNSRPHKEYGPKVSIRGYGRRGTVYGVVMDTSIGELSFMLNGMNMGVAFTGLPLDRPLVPCVLLGLSNDSTSIELDTSEVKEYGDNSIPAPSSITTKIVSWGHDHGHVGENYIPAYSWVGACVPD